MAKEFYELDLSDSLLDALDSMNFRECTPIQEATIPHILEGKDLIGIAQTGTGKTAAYLLPILDRLCTGDYPGDAINCLIMSPTRELAQQIDQNLTGFSYFMPVSSVAVYGGNDGQRYEQERRGLALGADIVIATPGRLISHISLGNVDLSKVSFFILDEADRMLDMGFYGDIMQIAAQLTQKHQTILFSATMPSKIEMLAQSLLTDPVKVALSISKPAEKIVQSAYVCHDTQKLKIIQSLFAAEKPERVLVFASTKQKVKEITHSLKRMNLNVDEMHSDLEQVQREKILHDFKNRRIDILVATDILSRGIDIDDISLVINYDVPHDCEDYIHRVGRTARANNDGRAITFVSDRDQNSFKAIENFIGKTIDKNPLPQEAGEGPEYAPTLRSGGAKRKARNQQSRYPKRSKRRGGKKEGAEAQQPAQSPQSAQPAAPQPAADSTPQPAQGTAPAAEAAAKEGEAKRKRRHRGGRHHRKKSNAAPGAGSAANANDAGSANSAAPTPNAAVSQE